MNVFSAILDILTTIWSFISNMVTATITAFTFITESLSVPFFLAGVMPTFIGACIAVVVFVSVIKLILGWSGE